MKLKPPRNCFCLVPKHHIRLYSALAENEIPQSKKKYVPSSGTYPKGFLAGSAHVGVKPSNTKFNDLTLIASEVPCSAAAVFTKNRFQAAPVTVSREILKARNGAGIRGVIVNSGRANAVTGKGGLEDARKMAEETDKVLSASSWTSSPKSGPETLVMSTGVIGQRLPIEKIVGKIPTAASSLGNDHSHWYSAARAICTTDTFPKLLSATFNLPSYPGITFSIVGMTKGAGMIHPNMATLLGIICTDAPVTPAALQSMLSGAIDRSFNSISIDGDTSTNDTVALLANGAACESSSDTTPIPDDPANADYMAMSTALTALSTNLAQLVVRDGEGATKFVTIRVQGAPSRDIGHRVASTIARSPLVKTALYGRDANWGRILCATGYADGIPDGAIEPEKVGVSFARTSGSAAGEELKLLVNGEPQNFDEDQAAQILAEEDLQILVRLQPEDRLRSNDEEVHFWTCDFSHEYVTINGDYRT